jgi:hypothetical protein
MKQPWEWDKSDLDSLIHNRVQENIGLDYKRCDSLANTDSKKKEISKDVSAFANSAGGIIVYGMIETGHVPNAIDEGFDPSVTSKEWLEQVINSNIQQRIDGIIINPIEISINKVVYVVYIPQSLRAPHQASDKKFYKRYNFQSILMEEYEVRDVSRRDEAPDLTFNFNVSVDNSIDPSFIYLMPTLQNASSTPAEYVVVGINIDSRLSLSSLPNDVKRTVNNGLTLNGEPFPCTSLYINLGIPSKLPIFKGPSFSILETPLAINVPKQQNYFFIVWSLMSPKMQQKSGTIALAWDGNKATIRNI